ncbi:hypothetical protein VNO77_38949 [Canavalia gladiata]|uniref:Uncharacterized protein n=1 Tax=Canavalia gladiata TaxID=3824 RepID=A0AAN9KC83_CANGL
MWGEVVPSILRSQGCSGLLKGVVLKGWVLTLFLYPQTRWSHAYGEVGSVEQKAFHPASHPRDPLVPRSILAYSTFATNPNTSREGLDFIDAGLIDPAY